jgi:hypothetical protein
MFPRTMSGNPVASVLRAEAPSSPALGGRSAVAGSYDKMQTQCRRRCRISGDEATSTRERRREGGKEKKSRLSTATRNCGDDTEPYNPNV